MAADPLARAGLQTLMADEDGCDVVGAADNVDDALLFEPDGILCDMGWQGGDLLPDLRGIDVPVVVLVADEEAAGSAWSAGAKGVIGRDTQPNVIMVALQAALHNLTIFNPDYVTQPILFEEAELIEPLTNREQDVLNLLAQGMTNRAIANALSISDHTVKFHVNALLTKLGAQSRTEAAVKATRMGLLFV